MPSLLPLGVDLAKASFVAAVWYADRPYDLGTFPNDSSGCTALAEAVQQLAAQLGVASLPVQLVVEPTGGYQEALVAFGHQQGWQVCLPNPRHVREWANGLGRRAKTDKEDARLLAHFAADGKARPVPAFEAEIGQLDSLLKRRDELDEMLRQERNRLEALRARHTPSPAVPASIERLIEALEAEQRAVEQALADLLVTRPDWQDAAQRLRSVPGIGPKSVLPVLLLLARWDALTLGEGSAKGLTAFVGLDPKPFESGTSVKRPPTISRLGDRLLRAKLYMAALGGIKGHNALRAFYLRLVARGKKKKLALVASARKLLTWALAVWRSGRPFDADSHPAAL